MGNQKNWHRIGTRTGFCASTISSTANTWDRTRTMAMRVQLWTTPPMWCISCWSNFWSFLVRSFFTFTVKIYFVTHSATELQLMAYSFIPQISSPFHTPWTLTGLYWLMNMTFIFVQWNIKQGFTGFSYKNDGVEGIHWRELIWGKINKICFIVLKKVHEFHLGFLQIKPN